MKSVLLLLAIAVSAFAGVKEIVLEGNELHDKGKYDMAIAKYKEAEKLEPENAHVKYELAYSYMAKGDSKTALVLAKEAMRLNKDERLEDAIANLLGSIYDEAGMPDSSLAVYERGFKKAPKSYLIPFNAGVTCMGAKRVDKAFEWFLKAADNTKYHEGTYVDLALASKYLNRWTDVYAYGMYALLFAKQERNINSLFTALYGLAKSSVTAGGKDPKTKTDSITVNIPPAKDKKLEAQTAFLMALAFANVDSIGQKKMYTPDSTADEQAEYLVKMLTHAVKLIAGFNKSTYDGKLLEFYQGLEKENLTDAFVHIICEPLSRTVFAKWRLIHANDSDRFREWMRRR